MESLPDCVLLQILSLLDDSADVARCRVASKAFNTLFPGLRSVNLVCTWNWYTVSNPSTPHPRIKPFQTVFLDLISKLECVDSVSLSFEPRFLYRFDDLDDKFYLTGDDFVTQWLPRVSASLKSLAITDRQGQRSRNVLSHISKYCHNLDSLKLDRGHFSMHDMNLMPTLTTLELRNVFLKDKELNELNRCLPNLQSLYLLHARGVQSPKIHLLSLKTCVWIDYYARSLTLIAPNLITLSLESDSFVAPHIEAPLLSQFHLNAYKGEFKVMEFENLKTLWLESFDIVFLLSKFSVTKTVNNLTLDSKNKALKDEDSKLTLGKLFIIFPNLTSLCIRNGAWLLLEAGSNRQRGCDDLECMKGLKFFCAYLKLVDPLLTFSSVACVLDQCDGLSEVSFLIHSAFVGNLSENFMSMCMNHWPGLIWRWGIWKEYMKDCWITDVGSSSKKHHKSSKKRHKSSKKRLVLRR